MMENQLKELYGRRATPVVKIFILIIMIFLGLHLVFSKAGQSDTTQAPINTSIDIQPDQKDS